MVISPSLISKDVKVILQKKTTESHQILIREFGNLKPSDCDSINASVMNTKVNTIQGVVTIGKNNIQ